MIKIIDLDSLFDKFITDYVYENVGKINPEEIEDKIPEFYTAFGDKNLQELDGFTPNTYYLQFDVQTLLGALKSHIENDVSVSDFLCEAILKSEGVNAQIIKTLYQENSEEFVLYLLNMLNDTNGKIPYERLIEFISYDYSSPIKELSTEILSQAVNDCLDSVIDAYNNASIEVRAYLTEILSHSKRDDRVFEILTREFILNQEEIPIYASYLSRYGDEKALSILLEAIEKEKISYPDFEELKFAIESLGGEYTKVRDFTKDKLYKKIHAKQN